MSKYLLLWFTRSLWYHYLISLTQMYVYVDYLKNKLNSYEYLASRCRPVTSMSPLRAINVSLPQQRKIPAEKWGNPVKAPQKMIYSGDLSNFTMTALTEETSHLQPSRHSTALSALWSHWNDKAHRSGLVREEEELDIDPRHTSGPIPEPEALQKLSHSVQNWQNKGQSML